VDRVAAATRLRSRWWINLGLAVLLAAAGAFLAFEPRKPAPAGFALVPLEAEDLRTISIERRDTPAVTLERTGRTWALASPTRARAAEIPVARLIELTRLGVATRMPAAELERFELDKPWARVTFNGHPVLFGNTNTITREVYVASGGYVMALPARHATAVPADLADLIALRLFADNEVPVAFELPGFAVRNNAGRWRIEPGETDLSQDDLVRWASDWRYASSFATRPQAQRPQGERIAIALEGGASTVFTLVAREPVAVLVREDERLEYHLPRPLAARLLSRPGTAPPEAPR